MLILGISAFYHDSAAAIILNGEVVAAAQEERFTRIKNDSSFPQKAIEFCLDYSNFKIDEIDFFVFYEKPIPKFERILETSLAFAPKGFNQFAMSMPIWLKDKLFQGSILQENLQKMGVPKSISHSKLLFCEHHLSHAASAFFPSPYEEAAILTVDGVGEWSTTSLAIGKNHEINVLKEIRFPHSLGLIYSAFTYFTGFEVNSGEYKMMGLAPYGNPTYVNKIKENLIEIYEDGSFRLNMDHFNYCTHLEMTGQSFNQLFQCKPRLPKEKIKQIHMDIAASIQNVTEEIIIKLAKHLKQQTKLNHLCMAGGVALNCVANGALQRTGLFKEIWIQPAAGDAGGSLGAALFAYNALVKPDRSSQSRKSIDGMQGGYLGPSFSKSKITKTLRESGANFAILNEQELIDEAVQSLIAGHSVGWVQGRMEFGPRALGARSILADPRSAEMQKNLNLKVKFRESFRPFAPCILEEKLSEWFELEQPSPYMLLVTNIANSKRVLPSKGDNELKGFKKLATIRSQIPAATHVDFSSRVQTVSKKTNPKLHKLLTKFYEKTGCPILLNTSFNINNEPIVCTPFDAYKCFLSTNIDCLAIENFWMNKEEMSR